MNAISGSDLTPAYSYSAQHALATPCARLLRCAEGISSGSAAISTVDKIVALRSTFSGYLMSWSAIAEEDLLTLLEEAEERMNPKQLRIWNLIKVQPRKWTLEYWGEQGDGFWVVGTIGNTVLWYNDIEDGFNTSTYLAFGKIEEYWCNQDGLEHSIQQLLSLVEDGIVPYKMGAPRPGPLPLAGKQA